MTDYELATFRLEVWKAIAGWGIGGDPKSKDILDKLVKTWDWQERMKRADELATWATRAEKASST
jgi:hypothetical protein